MQENSFNLELLRKQVKPFRLHWYSRLGSTNDQAALLRKRGELYAPAIVLAGHQTRGRGRNSNIWWSGPGSLTVTFVLPIDEHRLPHQLPLIVGLGVRSALARLSGDDAIQLKWPNDLLYRGKKLAGLLCERVHKADLIGLGLNVNRDTGIPRSLAGQIAWLSEIASRSVDKTELLVELAREIHPMLSRPREHPFGSILREYDRHHALIGRRVTIQGAPEESPVSGICDGLDSMGRLLVRDRGRTQRVIAGQVRMH